MYTKENFIEVILKKFPEFQIQWNEHLNYWDGEKRGGCIDMSEFSQYVVNLIKNEKEENLKDIFDLIEDFMINGDDDVQTAAATCFLENLINIADIEIPSKSFVHLLGKESIEYCKAWDEFTGVKTKGLY